jgi:pimeloyl-ACP methyl ester carboxylesterase
VSVGERHRTRSTCADASGARLALIREAGHFPWVEQPHAFREALDAFLAGIPPAE